MPPQTPAIEVTCLVRDFGREIRAADSIDLLRTEQAGSLIQLPAFVILFLAPVYVPVRLISGWAHPVATIDPATAAEHAAGA